MYSLDAFLSPDSIDWHEEVHAFRAEVRAQARAAGQIRRQERYVICTQPLATTLTSP